MIRARTTKPIFHLHLPIRYDSLTDSWSLLAPMTTKRSNLGVTVINNKLYAVGGHDGKKYLSGVEMYDPKSDAWAPITSMTRKKEWLGVGTLNNQLYAVGGHDGELFYAVETAEKYDPNTNSWSSLANMKWSRTAVSVAVF